ncbi:MAG: flippase-like domain-containing protein, partial [Treponema sp.]|nr:flippase-like domain-containing protein [Treponema sp.]
MTVHKTVKAAVKVIVSIALIVILVLMVNISEIAEAVSSFNLVWLGPALFFIVLGVVISAFKWQILLIAQGIHAPVIKLFRYYT